MGASEGIWSEVRFSFQWSRSVLSLKTTVSYQEGPEISVSDVKICHQTRPKTSNPLSRSVTLKDSLSLMLKRLNSLQMKQISVIPSNAAGAVDVSLWRWSSRTTCWSSEEANRKRSRLSVTHMHTVHGEASHATPRQILLPVTCVTSKTGLRVSERWFSSVVWVTLTVCVHTRSINLVWLLSSVDHWSINSLSMKQRRFPADEHCLIFLIFYFTMTSISGFVLFYFLSINPTSYLLVRLSILSHFLSVQLIGSYWILFKTHLMNHVSSSLLFFYWSNFKVIKI